MGGVDCWKKKNLMPVPVNFCEDVAELRLELAQKGAAIVGSMGSLENGGK